MQRIPRNLIQTVKPTHMLHFAWEATPRQYWCSLNNYLWVQASIELIYNFVKYGGIRAVMAGTCAEYDWKYGYLSEDITPSFKYNAICGHQKCSPKYSSFLFRNSWIKQCMGKNFFPLWT